MEDIKGATNTIKIILNNEKYYIDYYQREYKWGSKQVGELIEDLFNVFQNNYESGQERSEVENYNNYFLGSIIISQKDTKKYIIDGQQRLTSLSLILIYLNNRQRELQNKVSIENCIYSEKYGKKSFNLDIDDRNECMEILYKGEIPNGNNHSESVHNIIERYKDIQSYFPEFVDDEALPYFLDWLLEKVYIVVITTQNDMDAYTIFETMNDRGLSLNPTDMLKGYILSSIEDKEKKNKANLFWKKTISKLTDYWKDCPSDFLKVWFRSQYAESIRDRRKGARPGDFDLIGTEFHRWVRDNSNKLNLCKSNDFYELLLDEMNFFQKVYIKLLDNTCYFNEKFRKLFYNNALGFTLQPLLIMASINKNDTEEIIDKKIIAVSEFLDIFLCKKMWNFRSVGYSSNLYYIFNLSKDIRGKDYDTVCNILKERLLDSENELKFNDYFYLHKQNKRYIQHILSRITDYIERETGETPCYEEYFLNKNNNKYEVEHIIPNKYSRYSDEFPQENEFGQMRNQIGALLLLRKSKNASYNDRPYEEKVVQYFGENILAKTLNEKCYKNNPQFINFLNRNDLEFKSYDHFGRDEIMERNKLFQQLANIIWNPENIGRE